MLPLLPLTLITVFVLLSLLHIYWLCGGHFGIGAAIPEKNGQPAFVPSKFSTLIVAISLFACAVLITALAGWIALPLTRGTLNKLGLGLGGLFLLRAIGDFRLVGFFKRVRGTRFSKLDTTLYSPLCLGLALGVFVVVLTHPA